MSLDATRWAWKQKVKPTMKLILLSLADRSDESRCCFPSVARLSGDTGLDRKTIISGLKNLSELGLISANSKPKTKGKFTGNTYQLQCVKSRHNPSPKNGTRDEETGSQNRTKPGPKKGARTMSQKRDTNLPVLNLPMNLPGFIDVDLFGAFWEMRKKRGAENSELALKLLITKFEEIKNSGDNPNEAIETSILNGWKSVFPAKNKFDAHSQPRRNFPS